MPTLGQQRGAAAEAAARTHLQQAGLQMVAGNANYRGGELDLVMRDGPTLVFVEVRYRRHDRFGSGAASVDWRKRRKLVLAAQCFLASHPALAALPCRFDVVEVSEVSGQPLTLHWICDAFRAGDG